MSILLEQVLSKEGVFALMTIGLVIWQSKTNNDREKRYLDTIDNLSNNVSNRIDSMEADVKEIKEDFKEVKQDIKEVIKSGGR